VSVSEEESAARSFGWFGLVFSTWASPAGAGTEAGLHAVLKNANKTAIISFVRNIETPMDYCLKWYQLRPDHSHGLNLDGELCLPPGGAERRIFPIILFHIMSAIGEKN
jgi:hypothetical protein